MINENQLVLPEIPSVNKILRLSVSKVKTFLSCKKQYHFAYVLKLPRKDFEYHKLGRAVHLILEIFHGEYINGSLEQLNKAMSHSYKVAMKEFGHQLSEQSKKEIYDIIDKYLQYITDTQDTIKTITSVEKNFDFNITDKVVLNGMIDRIQTDNDGVIHVCDYKTTKNIKYIKNDFMQLLTYAYVIYSENPTIEKVRGSYILLRHNFEHITKEFSLDDILKIKEQYEGYAKQIESNSLWEANTTRLCAFCPFLDKCEEGMAFTTPHRNTTGKTNW
jgi:RecB family exonuclease